MSHIRSKLQDAQDCGQYVEWLAKAAKKEEEKPALRDLIIKELEALKETEPEERFREINNVIRYYSRANKGFQETLIELHKIYTDDELKEGTYDSNTFADRLLESSRKYELQIVTPIAKQIERQLQVEFPNSNILFLGRDFTPIYTYACSVSSPTRSADREPTSNGRFFLANISRDVRDAACNGRIEGLALLLKQVGLTKDKLVEKGLVITDSGKRAKIPAIVFKALTLDMEPSQVYQFLSHCHVRYMKSSKTKGMPLAGAALKMGAAKKELSEENINTLLGKTENIPHNSSLEGIKEFKIDFSTITLPQVDELTLSQMVDRRHKLFEWRPKVAMLATGIAASCSKSKAQLISLSPSTRSERISQALGLYADIILTRQAATERAIYEIDAVAKIPKVNSQILEASLVLARMRVWQKRDYLEAHEARKKMVVIQPPPMGFLPEMKGPNRPAAILVVPGQLSLYGEMRYKLISIAGEGRNVIAYITDKNTIVKVVKRSKNARKNLLLAWAEPLLVDYGFTPAKILEVGPYGLYVEQEYMPGDTLEQQFNTPVPRDDDKVGILPPLPTGKLLEKILQEFKQAKKLIKERGIWLDLKSANYHTTTCGGANGKEITLVNTDYVPRLNSTHYRYFKKANGADLTDEEFLDLFLYHSLHKH